MDGAMVAASLRDMLWVTLKLGGPPLLAVLAVGLVISLLQAVTQINEATVAFLPKALALGGALALVGPFMLATLTEFGRLMMDRLIQAGGG